MEKVFRAESSQPIVCRFAAICVKDRVAEVNLTLCVGRWTLPISLLEGIITLKSKLGLIRKKNYNRTHGVLLRKLISEPGV